METETVTGYVDHIIYRNAENGYTVLVLVVNEEELTCVGTFSDIAEGENIEAHGEYTEHATYGRQFKVVSFEQKETYMDSESLRARWLHAMKGTIYEKMHHA